MHGTPLPRPGCPGRLAVAPGRVLARTRASALASALASVLACTFAAPSLRAQAVPGRVAIGASAGPVVPIGELARVADPGYRVGLWVESPPSGGAAGRIEASLDHFLGDRAPPAGGRGGVSVLSLTANVVTTGRRERMVPGRVRAYVIGGLGIYDTRTSIGGVFGGVATGKTESRSRVGVNGGGGVVLPVGGAQLLLEARPHLLLAGAGYGSRNTGYLPIVLGLRF